MERRNEVRSTAPGEGVRHRAGRGQGHKVPPWAVLQEEEVWTVLMVGSEWGFYRI